MKLNKPLLLLLLCVTSLILMSAQRLPGEFLLADVPVIDFPNGITFKIKLDADLNVEKVNLLYTASGRTCQPRYARQPIDLEFEDAIRGEWEWEWLRSGILPPISSRPRDAPRGKTEALRRLPAVFYRW